MTKPRGYWTLERCKESAARFEGRNEWRQAEESAYIMAHRNGWIDECCAHMISHVGRRRNPWTLKRCRESAARFATRTEWIREHSAAYQAAHTRGWLDECCAHMEYAQLPNGYWTLERCKESAAQYSTRAEWMRESGSAYRTAQRNGWLDECCAHMEYVKLPNGYWTLERCKESAARFATRNEWHRCDVSAHSTASQRGWLDECCEHMEYDRRPSDYDTVYNWEVMEMPGVYKSGITSDRLGDQRIHQVASAAGLTPVIKVKRWVGRWNAFDLERRMKQIGQPVDMGDIDGKSEFRRLTAEELASMVRLVEEYPIL